MNRQYQRWFSPALEREMELLVFGHAGARLIAFPPARGRFFDWEDHGLIAALERHLENGWNQVYCVDSVDDESWFNVGIDPAQRARRQSQYDSYLREEVIPLTRYENANPYLIAAGVDFGAYHAANLGMRHPDCVNRIIGLDGLYDVRVLTDGYVDDEIYFNNPYEFVQGEHDPERLRLLRQLDIILAVSREAEHARGNEQFASILASKGLSHSLRFWGGLAHDWTYWGTALQHYVSGDTSYP